MFLGTFAIILKAILELLLVGALGFFLVRRRIVSHDGLKLLSSLVIGVFLPCLMFSEITARFNFIRYPNWWIFPFLSLLVTAVGYFFGLVFLGLDRRLKNTEGEFLGVSAFQNSGYLPLPLVFYLLPAGMISQMLIYIFLFLLGFNMTIFSLGLFLICPHREKKCRFVPQAVFNAPVIATLLALVFVFFKANRLIPDVVVGPLESLGRCAIPLSILVVGGSLAFLKTGLKSSWRPLALALSVKLVLVPLFFLGFVALVHPKPQVGFLLVLQAAMPPAALLSVISKNQNYAEDFVNQAIFYGHLLSIVTIPVFLALYEGMTGFLGL